MSSAIQTNPRRRKISLAVARTELMANFAVRGDGVYSRRFDVIRSQNLLRGRNLYHREHETGPGHDGRVGTADDTGNLLTCGISARVCHVRHPS